MKRAVRLQPRRRSASRSRSTCSPYGAKQLVAVAAVLVVLGLPRGLRGQAHLEAQVGTFLTRDQGWNWELNVLGRVGLFRRVSSRWSGVAHVTGRLSACPCGRMTSIPSPPESIENGIGVGVDVHRTFARERIYGLAGLEFFQAIGEEQARGGTAVVTGGLGWNWGNRMAWGTEVRYGGFGRALASTRGRLDLALVRRW